MRRSISKDKLLFRFFTVLILAISFLSLTNCNGKNSREPPLTEEELAALAAEAEAKAAIEAEAALRAQQLEKAALIAAALDIPKLAAQTLICGVDGKDALNDDMKILLGGCPAGGIMLFRYNLNTTNEGIETLITQTSEYIAKGTVNEAVAPSGIPPFVAVDHEGGTEVNRFRKDVATMPSAQSYSEMARNGFELRDEEEPLEVEDFVPHALTNIEADSFRAGTEIHTMGFNMNFAPVAELLTDDNREFLGTRSYGEDPAFTAEAAAAFVRGMGQAGIICVVKHFPGSAGIDPHFSPSALNYDKTQLDAFISPFTALIRDGYCNAVMVAHTLTPAIDPQTIASLSSVVMQDWLRGELGFDGIIVSDDFSMAASGDTRPETAAVNSLVAGSDMILVWPFDIRRTHRAIQAAIADGTLPEERLREAATRIIYQKIRLGLIDGEEE